MSAAPTLPTAPRRARLGHDERRRQILGCAQRLFSERHYGAVSMESVAQAAGVRRGLLHHYFGSKRELYVAVVREMFRAAPPVPEYVQGATVAQRVAESVDRWLDMVGANRKTWLASLGAEVPGRDPEIEAILDRVRESAVDSVIEVLGAGPSAQATPALRATVRAYGGLAEAATREWLERGRLDRAQLHTLLSESLMRLVGDVLPLLERGGGD